MSVSYGSADAKCPFYNDDSEKKIKCEDFIGETCKRGFKNETEKQKHKEEYCDVLENYENCPHYQEVYKKYI